MMWMDRELEEHQVYDHFSTLPPQAMVPQGNGVPPQNGIYAQLQQQPQAHSSTPTTTNSMGIDSSLGGDGSPPPMTMELDHDGPLHQHSTLPAVDHRLPMDNHHLDESQDLYAHQQHLYHQPHLLESQQAMMVSSGSSCLGGTYGDQETAMMMQSPNGDSDLLAGTLGSHHFRSPIMGQHPGDDKVTASKPGSTKDRKNYLQMYAR